MKDKLEIKINKIDANKKVKEYLSENLKLSRRVITRLYQERNILLNNEHPYLTTLLKESDELIINFTGKDASTLSLKEMDLDILYEDDDVLVIDKPAGLLAHPSKEHKNKDISLILKKKYGKEFIIRSIGRLDKDVSGIMLLAKNENVVSILNKQKENNLIHKYYSCLVRGKLNKKKDRLTYKLIKDEENHSYKVSEDGKTCITDYEVIAANKNYSLLVIEILTGRTHQIRCGMASINHPIVGDILYGDNHNELNRIGLHCSRIIFNHPITNQRIVVDSKLPEDMARLIR